VDEMIVIMPRIGMTMQDGKIIKWYYNDNEKIIEGEPLLDIETEKLVNTITAPCSGIFRKIAEEGDIILCGDPIAEINE
jgi:pyruvate dehydrogenase E2 component (dihydrolipoamide acetyltransferase)